MYVQIIHNLFIYLKSNFISIIDFFKNNFSNEFIKKFISIIYDSEIYMSTGWCIKISHLYQVLYYYLKLENLS